MSYARNIRRRQQREGQPHLMMLGKLLLDFYDFLGKTPQPTDNEVREHFTSSNDKWHKYCRIHKLMNVDHLFVFNVREAWKRHTQQLPSNQQQ